MGCGGDGGSGDGVEFAPGRSVAAVWTENNGIRVSLRNGWDLASAVRANVELCFRAHDGPFVRVEVCAAGGGISRLDKNCSWSSRIRF